MKVKDSTVSSFDAKMHLSRLLQEVEKGQSITITRRSKPVACLVPVQEKSEASVEHIAEELASIRKRVKGVFDVKELIREGLIHNYPRPQKHPESKHISHTNSPSFIQLCSLRRYPRGCYL